jgi:glycine/D-amino acid oxidase-like deaminating enzyme
LEYGRVIGVDTNIGPIETLNVVIAAGAWSEQLLRPVGVEIGLYSERAEVAFFDRPPDLKSGHLAYIDMITHAYFRPHAYGLTLAGLGTWETDKPPSDASAPITREVHSNNNRDHLDENISSGFIEEVQRRIARRVPGLAQARFVRGHVGLYDGTLDGLPVLDRVPGIPGLIVAVGWNGYGFTLAPAVGVCISELVTDGSATNVDTHPFRLSRFHEQFKTTGHDSAHA